MILATTSLIIAFVIAFGRQSAVLGKIKISLWFFSHFEKKRMIFTFVSVGLGLLSLFQSDNTFALNAILISALLLVLFAFFFDMTYFFPEIKTVEKKIGKDLGLPRDTKIMGVVVDDVALAYPFDVVMIRHIINDKINETGVLACFCAICRSGLIFSSTIDGETLYFKVAGVWRRNMIMVDCKTQSLWQQATGECIYGKFKGKQLTLLSGENTSWEAWTEKHPKSLFATKCVEARKGLLSRKSMMKGLEFATTRFTPPGFTKLKGLPKRDTVFGIDYNGISKAYPKSELKNISQFTDQYGDAIIQLIYNAKSEYLTAVEAKTQKVLIVEKHWWLGWKEFHPNTEIWKKDQHTNAI